MISFSLTIKNLDDYQKWIREQLVPSLAPREVLLLKGPMGVGKTQLVRYLVEELGVLEACSPSFAIHHRYEMPLGSVDHVDLYRLEDEEDLESTGFWDLFAQPEGLILIEWAERLHESFLPPNWRIRSITIGFGPEGQESQRRYLQVTEVRPQQS